MPTPRTRELIRARLARESGGVHKHAPRRIALVYPSPYRVGMSSLGYQQIYRILQAEPDLACERAFLPDGGDKPGLSTLEAPVTYESFSPLSDFPLIAVSVAYELELAGLLRMLRAAGIPPLARERDDHHPLIVVGGPLTFSNPFPLSPFVDAIVMGEAEQAVVGVVRSVFQAESRRRARELLAARPHVYVPGISAEPPTLAIADDRLLPARSVILTPDAELSNMFLIEAERGCSRTCQYCVMRRSSHGGMRKVPAAALLEAIPRDVRKVGLVGAAVSDHPQITDLVNELARRGHQVSLSSLRPDRLKQPFVRALRRAGYRTLTTALDGASERLRGEIERRGREPHYEALALHAREAGMKRLKLYLMLGLPGETDADVDECAAFVSKLSRSLPVALGIAPFCSKRRTPLDGQPFAGIDVVRKRLDRLRRGLRGRADVRSTSAKWAWVEFALAQGAEPEGLAVLAAVESGGSFSDYRRELERLGYRTQGPQAPRMPPPLPVPNVPSTLSRARRALAAKSLPLLS